MTIYKVYDSIPLFFERIRAGGLVTGLSVTVVVINAATGATLLASTALTEITPGHYEYVWNHGITVQTECVASYVVGGIAFKDTFTIDDTIKQIGQEEGRTT